MDLRTRWCLCDGRSTWNRRVGRGRGGQLWVGRALEGEDSGGRAWARGRGPAQRANQETQQPLLAAADKTQTWGHRPALAPCSRRLQAAPQLQEGRAIHGEWAVGSGGRNTPHHPSLEITSAASSPVSPATGPPAHPRTPGWHPPLSLPWREAGVTFSPGLPARGRGPAAASAWRPAGCGHVRGHVRCALCSQSTVAPRWWSEEVSSRAALTVPSSRPPWAPPPTHRA